MMFDSSEPPFVVLRGVKESEEFTIICGPPGFQPIDLASSQYLSFDYHALCGERTGWTAFRHLNLVSLCKAETSVQRDRGDAPNIAAREKPVKSRSAVRPKESPLCDCGEVSDAEDAQEVRSGKEASTLRTL